jgi:hypothetical protein
MGTSTRGYYTVLTVPKNKWVLCSTGPVLASTRQGNRKVADAAVGRGVLQCRVPAGAFIEGAGVGLEKTGLGRADDHAATQLGVLVEGSTDEVQAGKGGVGARSGRVLEGLRVGESFKGKKGVREVIEGVGHPGGGSEGNEASVATIMREGKGEVETTYAMLGPGRPLFRRVVDHHKLTWGWMGWAEKSWGRPRKPCRRREGGSDEVCVVGFGPRPEMIAGKNMGHRLAGKVRRVEDKTDRK